MADADNARLVIVLEAQSKKMQNQLAAVSKTIDQFAARSRKQFDDANSGNAASFKRVADAANSSFASVNKASGASRTELLELGHSARATFDILASGGSPLKALELEGAQVVQALAMGPGGLGGALAGIGEAALGLLTPINLAIAAVGLLAAGAVAWLVTENSHTVDATATLAEHKKWLDEILADYGDAKKAADAYIDSVSKLPEAAVASNLEASKPEQLKNAVTAIGEVQSKLKELSESLMNGAGAENYGSAAAVKTVQDLIDVVRNAGLTATSSKQQFDNLVTTLTDLKNSGDKVGPVEAYLAGQMLDLVLNAEKASASVNSVDVALNHLPNSVQVKIDVAMAGYNEARQKLADLMPDTRDRYTKARDDATAAYNAARGAAPDDIERQVAKTQYDAVIAGIDKEEQSDNAKKGIKSYDSEAKRIDNVTSSLKLQLAQLTMTDREKAISNALSTAHVTASSAEGKQIATLAGQLYDQQQAQKQVNDAVAEFEDVEKSALSSFISDLEDGKSAAEALGDALKDVGNALLEAGINSLVGDQTSGLTGWFDSLLKNGFDDGGYTGPGGKKQVAGVVHKGEVVWSQDDVSRHGGAGAVDAMRRGMGGYADGGIVRPVGRVLGPPHMLTPANGSSGVHVNITVPIDASGADPMAIARLTQAIAQMKADLPHTVIGAVRTAKKQRKL